MSLRHALLAEKKNILLSVKSLAKMDLKFTRVHSNSKNV